MTRRRALAIVTRRSKGTRTGRIRPGQGEEDYEENRQSDIEEAKRRGEEDHEEVKRQGEERQ